MIPAWSTLADKLKRLAVQLDAAHQPKQAEYTRSAELALRRTRISLGSKHDMTLTAAFAAAQKVYDAYSPSVAKS